MSGNVLGIAVTVFHRQDNFHCSQIYTGLSRLHRQGEINLAQVPWRRSPFPDLLDSQPTIVVADVDGRMICFDMRDTSHVDRRFLEVVDLYFKRSFDPAAALGGQEDRVRSLGFNYDVWDDGIDWPAVQRLLQGTGTLGSLARRLGLNVKFQPRVRVFEGEPQLHQRPAVLFQTRLWGASRHHDCRDTRQDRTEVNETRIACLRLLRAELGSAFIGGLAPSELAHRVAPDLVCPAELAGKAAYLRLVKSTPICITTTGLHGSNGWKMGEYVATARAIVCEPLLHQVPGGFREGRNYLGFRTPEECVSQAVALMEDRSLRIGMMLHNLNYYRSFLRPEALVLNAILALTKDAPAPIRVLPELRPAELRRGAP